MHTLFGFESVDSLWHVLFIRFRRQLSRALQVVLGCSHWGWASACILVQNKPWSPIKPYSLPLAKYATRKLSPGSEPESNFAPSDVQTPRAQHLPNSVRRCCFGAIWGTPMVVQTSSLSARLEAIRQRIRQRERQRRKQDGDGPGCKAVQGMHCATHFALSRSPQTLPPPGGAAEPCRAGFRV